MVSNDRARFQLSRLPRRPILYYPGYMTSQTPEPDADRIAARTRVEESLRLNATKLETARSTVQRETDARLSLVRLALADADKGKNLLSYDEVAAACGITRAAVYKIIRDGKEPLGKQREKAAAK